MLVGFCEGSTEDSAADYNDLRYDAVCLRELLVGRSVAHLPINLDMENLVLEHTILVASEM